MNKNYGKFIRHAMSHSSNKSLTLNKMYGLKVKEEKKKEKKKKVKEKLCENF